MNQSFSHNTSEKKVFPEKPIIHLVGINTPPNFLWDKGEMIAINYTVQQLLKAIEIVEGRQGYTLFWDFSIGMPNLLILEEALIGRGDLWHGNFSMNPDASPILMPFAHPCWMLNLSPKERHSFISWKMDFRSTLIKNQIFEKTGNIFPLFLTPEAATLEFGLRCIKHGVVPVFLPQLNPSRNNQLKQQNSPIIPIFDEVLFMRLHFRNVWVWWASFRAITKTVLPLVSTLQALFSTRHIPMPPKRLFNRSAATFSIDRETKVSVVMITLGRYDYITTVIDQLLVQTIIPQEIIIVDATPKNDRIHDSLTVYKNSPVPLRIMYSEVMGQCTQRNMAIKEAQGEYILFIDDDMDEIPVDHIHKHLQNIHQFMADVSCGTPDEVGALPVDRNTAPCVSDVFPTNDSLIKRSTLMKSGLFDERMDRGQSEDHELGIRIFLSGALMIKDPRINSLHLRASTGGLRTHKSRVFTYNSSRTKIFHRRLPHASELYLREKFFSSEEVMESILISILGGVSIRGSIQKKILKIIVFTLFLPNTIYKLLINRRQARKMLKAKANFQ